MSFLITFLRELFAFQINHTPPIVCRRSRRRSTPVAETRSMLVSPAMQIFSSVRFSGHLFPSCSILTSTLLVLLAKRSSHGLVIGISSNRPTRSHVAWHWLQWLQAPRTQSTGHSSFVQLLLTCSLILAFIFSNDDPPPFGLPCKSSSLSMK